MRAGIEAAATEIVAAVAGFFIFHLVWALIWPKSFWWFASRFGVPLIMTGSWIFLAYTSESDNTGLAWMAVGFGFVAVLWFMFRVAIGRAGRSRAVANGDAERLLKIARGPVERALAREMRGEWSQVIGELADVRDGDAGRRLLAACARAGAHVELGDPVKAREALAAAPKLLRATLHTPPLLLVSLAEARVRWAEGELDTAAPLLQKVVDDIRTGAYTRAEAHAYLARIAETRGDGAAVARHRDEAAKLAPGTWVAS
jgi:hypothetical protein